MVSALLPLRGTEPGVRGTMGRGREGCALVPERGRGGGAGAALGAGARAAAACLARPRASAGLDF